MNIVRTSSGFVVRLHRGQRLIESLVLLAENEKINGAFFYGLGGADSARLGIYYADDRRSYDYKWFAGPLEVTNVTGNISIYDNKIKVHAHATISGVDLNVSGGHVEELIVGPTLELFITPTDSELRRVYDEQTGLPLLDV